MISKKITQLLKILFLILGIISGTIGTMYLLSRMICKKNGATTAHTCCSHNHHHTSHHNEHHEHTNTCSHTTDQE